MSNAANSRIASNAVDTIDKIMRLAKLGLAHDDKSIAAAALKDILATIKKFSAAEMKEPS